jgi:hypothetical protein
VHTQWQWPISGVHSIMMEKLALVMVRVHSTQSPTPFRSTVCTITYKVAVYAPDERADSLPVFHPYPTCNQSVVMTHDQVESERGHIQEVHSGF